MENLAKEARFLGLVTLYNPDPHKASENIKMYVANLDQLLIWDNSPLSSNMKEQIMSNLDEFKDQIIWYGNGENHCIAPAINHAWHFGKENGYDLLLIMDQDSQWADFATYRKEIERHYTAGEIWVYTPYVAGLDIFHIHDRIQERRFFINSGTVIPISILNSINGADEIFPLDAVDHDMALRILKRGYSIRCLTSCILYHTIGQPRRSNLLNLYTPDYGLARTYSTTRSHVLNYRKNRQWMTPYERRLILKEFVFWKFVRIILVESDKWQRLKQYFRGLKDGLCINLQNAKP